MRLIVEASAKHKSGAIVLVRVKSQVNGFPRTKVMRDGVECWKSETKELDNV